MPHPNTNFRNVLVLAGLFAGAALTCAAQSSATQPGVAQSSAAQPASSQQDAMPAPAASLPAAPSSVLAKEAEALSKPAGSSLLFTAPSSTVGPGGVRIEQPLAGPLKLSLDDAIALGLSRNLRILYDAANQRAVKGDELQVINALLPSLNFLARSTAQEINLAAMGFKPSETAKFANLFPPGAPPLATIVKVDTTDVQISANQYLFDASAFELYKGAKREKAVVELNALNGRGDLVLAVGQAYLKVLADQSSIADAQAQEASSKLNFSQASDRQQAGVGTSLDSLRAQVQYQQDQQTTISSVNQMAKDIIQLNRIMGLPASQQLELTDTAPYAELAGLPLDAAKETAFAHRKDYLSLIAQLDVEQRELKAIRYQRFPTLAFNGFYGVLGQTQGSYHGVFAATGSLKFPIFNEAAQRGQQDELGAQIMGLQQELASVRVDVEAQIRSAMLDVEASHQLVAVAQSNVELARQELSDEHDRFTAGIDTNLPVLDAQSSVTGAQAQLVQALYQYNVAKLSLARATGVVETRYRTYLGQ
jgi:outer membrane protein TolC